MPKIGISSLLHMKVSWIGWGTSGLSPHCHFHYYWYPFFHEIPNRFYFLLTGQVDKFVFVITADYSHSFASSLMRTLYRFVIVLPPSSSSIEWSPSVLGLAEHEFRFVLLPSGRMIRSCPWILCRLLHSNLTQGKAQSVNIWWLQICASVTIWSNPNLVSMCSRKFRLKLELRWDGRFLLRRSL